MSAADRKRDQREREKAGLAVYCITAPAAGVEDMLVVSHFLALADADDRARVDAALERLVLALIDVVTRDNATDDVALERFVSLMRKAK